MPFLVEGGAADDRDRADRTIGRGLFERSSEIVPVSVTTGSAFTRTLHGTVAVEEDDHPGGAELCEDGADLDGHLRSKCKDFILLQQAVNGSKALREIGEETNITGNVPKHRSQLRDVGRHRHSGASGDLGCCGLKSRQGDGMPWNVDGGISQPPLVRCKLEIVERESVEEVADSGDMGGGVSAEDDGVVNIHTDMGGNVRDTVMRRWNVPGRLPLP